MSFLFSPKFNENKLKTNLRVSVNRLKLLEKKKTEIAVKSRKEVADYIAANKEDRARIRAEQIVREDYLVEAMELVEMYCDLLLSRFGLIQTQSTLDPGLEETVATMIWVSSRLQADCPELSIIAKQLEIKYGLPFTQDCRTNKDGNVSEKVMHKLSAQAPPKQLVELYMVEIARSFNIPFEPNSKLLAGPEDDECLLDDEICQPPPVGWFEGVPIHSPPPSYQLNPPPLLGGQSAANPGLGWEGYQPMPGAWLPTGFSAPPNLHLAAGGPTAGPLPLKGSLPPTQTTKDNTPPWSSDQLPPAGPENESASTLDFDELSKRFESLKKRSD